MALISGEEIAKILLDIVKEVRENPEFKLECLYNAGAILVAIGLIKKIYTLRTIGEYILGTPSKLRPLLAYKYQLLGGIGELEEKIGRQIDATLNKILEIIEDIANKLKEEQVSDEIFIRNMGELVDIFSKTSTFRE